MKAIMNAHKEKIEASHKKVTIRDGQEKMEVMITAIQYVQSEFKKTISKQVQDQNTEIQEAQLNAQAIRASVNRLISSVKNSVRGLQEHGSTSKCPSGVWIL
jgi:hypothetical protein